MSAFERRFTRPQSSQQVYTEEMRSLDDETTEYFKTIYEELQEHYLGLYPHSTEREMRGDLCFWNSKQQRHFLERLRERAKAALIADGHPSGDNDVDLAIRAMRQDTTHPYKQLLRTVRHPLFLSFEKFDVHIDEDEALVAQRRVLKWAPDVDWAHVYPLKNLPEPYRTAELLVHTVFDRAMELFKLRQEMAQEKEKVWSQLQVTFPQLGISDQELGSRPVPLSEDSQLKPALDQQKTLQSVKTFTTSRQDYFTWEKGPYPFRGQATVTNCNNPVLSSPSFENCLYTGSIHGVQASILKSKGSKDGASILFAVQDTPAEEEDTVKCCLLDAASLDVNGASWDVVAIHIKTESGLGTVKSKVTVAAFNSRTFVPIASIAGQDMLGSPVVMVISHHADCLAMVTEEEPDTILLYRWPMVAVRKALDMFQRSVANADPEPAFPKNTICQLALVRRIQAPLSILDTIQMSCSSPKDFSESQPHPVAGIPGEQAVYATTVKVSEIVRRIQTRSRKAKNRQNLQDLFKQTKERKFPNFFMASGSVAGTDSSATPREKQTRSIWVMYESTPTQLYGFVVPATPGSSVSTHSGDMVDIMPVPIEHLHYNPLSETLICVTQNRSVCIFDKHHGHFVTCVAVPEEVGCIHSCLLQAAPPEAVSASRHRHNVTGGSATSSQSRTVLPNDKSSSSAVAPLPAGGVTQASANGASQPLAQADRVLLVGGSGGKLARLWVHSHPSSTPTEFQFAISSKPTPLQHKGEIMRIVSAGSAYPSLVYCCYSSGVLALHNVHSGNAVQHLYPLDYQELDLSSVFVSSSGNQLCVRCWESVVVEDADLTTKSGWYQRTVLMDVARRRLKAAPGTLAAKAGACHCIYRLEDVPSLAKWRVAIADKTIPPFYHPPMRVGQQRQGEHSWQLLSQYYEQHAPHLLKKSRFRKTVEITTAILKVAQRQQDLKGAAIAAAANTGTTTGQRTRLS